MQSRWLWHFIATYLLVSGGSADNSTNKELTQSGTSWYRPSSSRTYCGTNENEREKERINMEPVVKTLTKKKKNVFWKTMKRLYNVFGLVNLKWFGYKMHWLWINRCVSKYIAKGLQRRRNNF